ncbi:MAG: hypothetical protein WC900_01375 [Oscillospiraceae bacterium]|jgi:hypothetical protein
MKRVFVFVLLLSMALVMAACDKDDKDEKSSKDKIHIDLFSKSDEESISDSTDEIVNNSDENPGEAIDNFESWVEFDECFYGYYYAEVPYEDGTDQNGDTKWGMYEGSLNITKDCISIDVPEGKYELTSENSILMGDNILELYPLDLIAEDWRFLIHNKENLQAGCKSIGLQTATYQYTFNKD